MKSTILILILFVLGATACTHQNVDRKAEGEKIIKTSQEWSDVAATGDVDKTVNYWADNAIMMSAGDPVVKGKTDIRKMVEHSYKIPGFRISWKPLSVEVSESGDMAYLIETSQVAYKDSTGNTHTNNYNAVSIWKKQVDGTWKNAVDISTPVASQY